MPLLYTMEMWRHGMTASEWHLLLLLAASLVVNFVFSLSSGFRHRYSPVEAASESVSAVALGMVYSFAVLWLIGEVGLRQPWSENLGKVLIETAPVSLGISFANYQMRNRSREGDGGADGEGADDPDGSERAQAGDG